PGMDLDADAVRCLCGHVYMGRQCLLSRLSRTARRTHLVCRRQAMDVEMSASRGPTRDQHAARPRRTTREAAARLGRRYSQLFCAGISHAYGRSTTPLYFDVV